MQETRNIVILMQIINPDTSGVLNHHQEANPGTDRLLYVENMPKGEDWVLHKLYG